MNTVPSASGESPRSGRAGGSPVPAALGKDVGGRPRDRAPSRANFFDALFESLPARNTGRLGMPRDPWNLPFMPTEEQLAAPLEPDRKSVV